MEDAEGQADHLQVLGAGGGGDVAGLGADVEDDAALEPGDEEVGALADDGLLDALQTVEDDGPRAALDVVDGRLDRCDPDRCGHRPAI